MRKPLVSIIIPTFNRAHLIGETLNSVLAQTYPYWECIIIDDGSTDNSKKIIGEYVKKDFRFHYYNRPKEKIKGLTSCRNYGFSLSKGDYISWFDSDDLYFSNALETYINLFLKSTDVVVARLEKVDLETGNKIGESKIISNNIIEDYFIGKISFYVYGPFWRRKFLENQIDLFDEKISNLEDWDFNLRMLYENPEIVFYDKPLTKYRIHNQSLIKEIGKLNFNEINSEMYAREKHLTLINNNKKANVLVLKIFIVQRYKYFFREAMVKNDKYRLFYLKNLLKKELEILDFKGVIKTLFGFVIFSIFNKGYKLLK